MFGKQSLIAAAVGTAIAASSASAATLAPFTAVGWTDDRPTSTLTDEVQISKPDPADPTTWVNNHTGWNAMYVGIVLTGATNSKQGWFVLDLGSDQPLDALHLLNANYQNQNRRSVNEFNVYTASIPTVAATGGAEVDYDFASGGWTLRADTNFAAKKENKAIDLTGVTARYIGVELISAIWENGNWNAVNGGYGIEEAAVTIVPEPTSLALIGLGGLLIARRRRG